MDLPVLDALLEETYGRKKGLLDANRQALRLGRDYAREHFACPLPVRAGADGRHRADHDPDRRQHGGGARLRLRGRDGGGVVPHHPVHVAGGRVHEVRQALPQGRGDGARGASPIVQAEDELAAAGMVIGASVGGRARVHRHRRAGDQPDERVHRPGLLRRDPRRHLRRAAHRPVHGDADAHAAGRPAAVRLRLPRRHEAHRLYPGRPGGVLRVRRGARSTWRSASRRRCSSLSDLDIGMNDWMVPRLRWDDSYRPDRGKVLDGGGAGGDRQVQPLPGRRRRRDRRAHAARRAPEGRVLHPRLRPQPARRVHRRRGGVRGGDGAAGAEDRLRRGAPSRRRRCARYPARRSASSRVGGCHRAVLEAWSGWRSAGWRRTTCACAAFPSPPAVEEFLAAHDRIFVVEQNRDGQLAHLLSLETGVPRRALEPVARGAGCR